MRKSLVRPFLYAVAALSFVVWSAFPAQAQVPSAQTGSASPGRVDKHFQQHDLIPATLPKIEVRELKVQGAPPGADKVPLVLRNLTLEGVTVYTHRELERVYEGRLGTNMTLADLYTIAADLTRKYRNDGYVLTQIVVPPQTIDGGNAKLMVVEGYIDRVEVRGDEQETALPLIRQYAAHVKTDEEAVNIASLERALLTINDLPGVSARGVLSPSPNKTGAADLLVVVERHPYDAVVSIDNFGSRFLGPVQLSAAGSLNSFFGNNEKLTGQFVVSPERHSPPELYYAGLSYEQPISSTGTTFELFGNNTYTNPGYTLDEFDVLGRSQLIGLRFKHPLIRTRALNVLTRLTFDMRNVNSKNNAEPTRKDRIRAVRLGSRFEYLDTLFGAGFNVLDLEASRGMEVFGASNTGEANISRPGADPHFVKIAAEAQRLQRLMAKLNLLVGVTGQWSNGILYSSEEFGVGGQAYGRGYDPSEVVGNDGVAGKLELQWNRPYEADLFENYQLYSFYDAGVIWNSAATTSSQKQDSVASTGLGIRADLNEATSGGLMLAFPLTRSVQTNPDTDARLYMNLSRKF